MKFFSGLVVGILLLAAAVWFLAPRVVAGNPGAPGEVGLIGPVGPMGQVGPQGPQGLKGDQGLIGLSGSVGPEGRQGTQGLKGETGPQGLTGPVGPTGSVCPKGQIGPPGPGILVDCGDGKFGGANLVVDQEGVAQASLSSACGKYPASTRFVIKAEVVLP